MTVDLRADRLAIETGVVAGLAGLGIGAGLGLMQIVTTTAAARGWVLVTTAVVAWEIAFLWRNRRANGSIAGRTALGAANLVTLVRGALFAGVAGFVVVEPVGVLAWGPAVLYGVGVSLDAVDGVVARTLGEPTQLGEKLDLAFDTLGFLVAPIVGVAWGRLPVWYLTLATARYWYRLGLWVRRRRGRPVGTLPDSRVRRPLAAVQMAFITGALAPVVPTRLVAILAALVVVPSLAVFVRDYLAVTGRLPGVTVDA